MVASESETSTESEAAFAVHSGLFKRLGTLENHTFHELKQILEAEDFRDMGKTPAGYHKFYGPGARKERAIVWIRPDGQIERVGHSRNSGSRRFNHNGEIVNHRVGELLKEYP